ICALLSETDLYRRAAANAVPIPIGDSVTRGTAFGAAVNAAQILRPGGITRIFAASRHEQNQASRDNCLQNTKKGTSHKLFDGVLNAQAAQKVKRGQCLPAVSRQTVVAGGSAAC